MGETMMLRNPYRVAALMAAAWALLSGALTSADPVEGLATFSAGATARADEVNGNFSEVAASVNDNDTRIAALEEEIAALKDILAVSDARYQMHWLVVSANAAIRAASPGLENTVIFRPASEPTGIYCLVFPDGVPIDRDGTAGTIEDNFTNVQDSGIAVNTTIATACVESGQNFHVTVTTTDEDALANRGFRLLIPPAR